MPTDYSEVPDEELVELFNSKKDSLALDELLRRHETKVYGVAYRVMGNRADALDATQEVFMLVMRKLSKFKGASSFGTWLYRLSVNASIDLLRKQRRAPIPSEVASDKAETSSRWESSVADERMDVERALSRLPDENRIAIVLRDIAGLSYIEISEAIEAPVGTVKSRIARGRRALGELLTASSREPSAAQHASNEETGSKDKP